MTSVAWARQHAWTTAWLAAEVVKTTFPWLQTGTNQEQNQLMGLTWLFFPFITQTNAMSPSNPNPTLIQKPVFFVLMFKNELKTVHPSDLNRSKEANDSLLSISGEFIDLLQTDVITWRVKWVLLQLGPSQSPSQGARQVWLFFLTLKHSGDVYSSRFVF